MTAASMLPTTSFGARRMAQPATFFSGADGDGSGLVNEADYDLWRSQFGGPTADGRGSRIGAGTGHDCGMTLAACLPDFSRRPERFAPI